MVIAVRNILAQHLPIILEDYVYLERYLNAQEDIAGTAELAYSNRSFARVGLHGTGQLA